jgi:hypothetical protein
METWTAAQLGEFLAGVDDDPRRSASGDTTRSSNC